MWFDISGVLQAEASAQRGTLLPREKHKHAYDKALVQRYQHMPEVRRIVKHRHLPTAIYKVRHASRRPRLACCVPCCAPIRTAVSIGYSHAIDCCSTAGHKVAADHNRCRCQEGAQTYRAQHAWHSYCQACSQAQGYRRAGVTTWRAPPPACVVVSLTRGRRCSSALCCFHAVNMMWQKTCRISLV